MCVKEFFGYDCGHCSVPTLRQCPLARSNPTYPICQYPAERPIFQNTFCHPCYRIVWNEETLAKEEFHRQKHLRGECIVGCPVVFPGENKVRGREGSTVEREEYIGYKIADGKATDGEEQPAELHGAGFAQLAHELETGHDVAVAPSFEAGFQFTADEGVEPVERDVAPSILNHTARAHSQSSESSSAIREKWNPEDKMAAYKYVGLYVVRGDTKNLDMSTGAGPNGSQAASVFPDEMLTQPPVPQTYPRGAGMKWYPEGSNFQPQVQLNQEPRYHRGQRRGGNKVGHSHRLSLKSHSGENVADRLSEELKHGEPVGEYPPTLVDDKAHHLSEKSKHDEPAQDDPPPLIVTSGVVG